MNAVKLLEKNVEKIYWPWLPMNPNAIQLLEKYPQNIEKKFLCMNENAAHLIFKLDYQKMAENIIDFKTELYIKVAQKTQPKTNAQ